MVASLADVEDGVEVGSLSAGGEHRPYSTLEGSNLRSHSVVGGVLQTGIEIALFLQVEEIGHFLGVIILKRGALIDGEHACFAVFRLPATLYTERGGTQFFLHVFLPIEYFI